MPREKQAMPTEEQAMPREVSPYAERGILIDM